MGLKQIPILYENDHCLVFNKPAGLPVQGGEGINTSLDSILGQNYSPRPLLVHRLDRDTSGVILVARTREAAAGFSAMFSSRSLVKRYLGVCSGIPVPESGAIRESLEAIGKGHAKKESDTYYRLLSSANAYGNTFALLELEIGTGRTHQIRRHLAFAGCPLLGDDKYGDFSLNKKMRKEAKLKNLLLHSYRMIIPPMADFLPEGLDISAPLPCYFPEWVDLSSGLQ